MKARPRVMILNLRYAMAAETANVPGVLESLNTDTSRAELVSSEMIAGTIESYQEKLDARAEAARARRPKPGLAKAKKRSAAKKAATG